MLNVLNHVIKVKGNFILDSKVIFVTCICRD